MTYFHFSHRGEWYRARRWIDQAGGQWIDVISWTKPPRGADLIGACGAVCHEWRRQNRDPWKELFRITLDEL